MGALSQHVLELLPHALVDAVVKHGSGVMQCLGPILDEIQPRLVVAQAYLDLELAAYKPWEVVLLTVLTTAVLILGLSRLMAAWRALSFSRLRKGLFDLVHLIPPIRTKIAFEKAKLRKGILSKRSASEGDKLEVLPRRGMPAALVTERLRSKARRDVQLSDGRSMVSGTVYMSGAAHKSLLDDAYTLFSYSNPLHPDTFPSVRQMEAEVVAMTGSFLGGGAAGNPEVCGAMTGGGSESILTAIKASRDYMRHKRGITHPEMIIACSAHAAYFKAAEYFNIKLHVVPVGSDYRLSANMVRRYLTKNTVVVVASAPGYPHGVIDHVADIAPVTRHAGVCLHVDACLGGFVLPFARTHGFAVPPFDFAVKGVTSMSVDTHKFGMAHKGTSVVLYSSADIRQHQYTSITEWTGGLYISPGMAGSRPGALIATAWASLVHLGEEGFMETTKQIMEVVQKFTRGLVSIPDLELVARPDMSVVAFKAKDPQALNIYQLNDLMTKRGWQLNALQKPAALHFCFTAMHVKVVDDLLKDLAETAVVAKGYTGPTAENSAAPMYGMANVSPDRGLLADFLVAYQDVMLMP